MPKKELEQERERSRIKETKFAEILRYDFTDQERLDLAKKMTEAMQVLNQHELKLKEVTARIKSDITQAETQINDLGNKVRNGYEYRDVECKQVADYENREKTVWRLDSNTLVRTTRMTPEELQTELDFQG